MSDPRPEFVLRFDGRGLFYTVFAVCALYAAWFAVVLWGENQGWTDDPGRWATLPTNIWAFLGAALFACLLFYAVALLTIRERPGQIYRIEGEEPTNEPTTPSFLQPAEGENAADQPGDGSNPTSPGEG